MKIKKYNFKILFVVLCSLILISCEIPNNHKIAISKLAELNVELGLEYLKQNNLSRAKEKLLTAINLSPKKYATNVAFGYFMEKIGEEKRAEKYYILGIKYSDSKTKGAALNNYGTFLYRQKRYKEALKYFLLAANDSNYLNFSTAKENAKKTKNRIFAKRLNIKM